MESPNNTFEKLTPVPFAPPRFEVGDPSALDYFKAEGYVVFKDIISTEEIETGKTLMWKWLATVNPEINKADLKTWGAWPKTFPNGIIYADGIGQSEFMWYLRERKKVREVFSTIWNSEELVTSFDGCSILRPVDVNLNWKTTGLKLHLDQNLKLRPGFQCVQGGLNLLDSDENDGGFVVVPRSHLVVHEIFKLEQYKKAKNHFILLPTSSQSEPWSTVLKDLPRPIKVCLKAGDFVVWDSRSIHANVPPSLVNDKSSPKYSSIRRIVAFICMIPSSHVTDKNIFRNRKEGVNQGVTTSHWPIEYHARKPLPPNFVPPKLNSVQLQLVAPSKK